MDSMDKNIIVVHLNSQSAVYSVPRLVNVGINSISLVKMISWSRLRALLKQNFELFRVNKRKMRKCYSGSQG